jgi:hypothetical protein
VQASTRVVSGPWVACHLSHAPRRSPPRLYRCVEDEIHRASMCGARTACHMPLRYVHVSGPTLPYPALRHNRAVEDEIHKGLKQYASWKDLGGAKRINLQVTASRGCNNMYCGVLSY